MTRTIDQIGSMAWYTVEDNKIVSFNGTLVDAAERTYPCFLYEEQAIEYLCALDHLGYRQVLKKKAA